jgi:hypothetical protein
MQLSSMTTAADSRSMQLGSTMTQLLSRPLREISPSMQPASTMSQMLSRSLRVVSPLMQPASTERHRLVRSMTGHIEHVRGTRAIDAALIDDGRGFTIDAACIETDSTASRDHYARSRHRCSPHRR